jgi:hypothetical protein
LADQFRVFVVLLPAKVLKKLELSSVFLSNIGQSNNTGSLLVYKGTKTCLVLDNHERNIHLSAKGGKPHDKLDGVNVAGNKNKLSLLFLDKSGDMLQTKLDDIRSLAGRVFLSGGLGGSDLLDALLLGGRSLRSVLVEKGEDSHGLILSKSLGELVDAGGDLQTLVKDSTLTLDANVLGPSDESTQITSGGADIASNSEITGLGGEDRISGPDGGGLTVLLGRLLSFGSHG